ncbi:MAG: 2,3-bisphosphoglycerate-independent phosphoglycerate mutase [archaeon]
MKREKVILIIRDGWGYRKSDEDNALVSTPTPNTDRLMKQYPNTLLKASGEAVGLPEGYQGNSEVGHLTIGSGRIINQSLTRINYSINNGDFYRKKVFLKAIKNCKSHGTSLHLIGLLQVEGVHAHIGHLFALLDLCRMENFRKVYVHVITDGRDAPVTESLEHVKDLLDRFSMMGFGKIATISGRYYAMDRDQRWDRTKKFYDAVVYGQSEKERFEKPLHQITNCHAMNETDEFIKPRIAFGYEGMQKHDSVIFYNFRTDRPRQFTKAVVEKKFDGWKRKPLKVFYVAMTDYYRPMRAKVAFKEEKIEHLLGEIVSKKKLKQFRISETEKYAHVTFFFNGQVEKPYKNEDRIMIPSPKVATYDLQPEMSVFKIANTLVEKIHSQEYDLIVTNLVNGDMVGHTGDLKAIKKAITAVDEALGKIVHEALDQNYTILVFADHGNVEDQTSSFGTSHTTNPVPLILISNNEELKKVKLPEEKGLQDIAPTVLKLLGLKKPEEMTGESLV